MFIGSTDRLFPIIRYLKTLTKYKQTSWNTLVIIDGVTLIDDIVYCQLVYLHESLINNFRN